MLVTDFQLRTLTRNLEELLPQNGIKCIVYDKTRPNPTVSNVEEALQIYKENNCKGLIAFGGDSSMDCAKAVGARRNMLMALHLAGGAFSRSYVGYVHAVAHSLGGAYNIPHGLANSVLLPVVLKRYGSKVYKKLKQLAVAAGLADKNDSAELAAKNFIRQIEELNARLDISETLKGIKAEDIPELAKRADKEANPIYPVPVLWNARELEQFYYAVMEKNEADKKSDKNN